jgi:hypothetical protein
LENLPTQLKKKDVKANAELSLTYLEVSKSSCCRIEFGLSLDAGS